MGYKFLGVKVREEHLATLDALMALTDNPNRSETLRQLLDAPVASLLLAIQSTGIVANKKTAHLRQTGGAGLTAITEGAISSDNSILHQVG